MAHCQQLTLDSPQLIINYWRIWIIKNQQSKWWCRCWDSIIVKSTLNNTFLTITANNQVLADLNHNSWIMLDKKMSVIFWILRNITVEICTYAGAGRGRKLASLGWYVSSIFGYIHTETPQWKSPSPGVNGLQFRVALVFPCRGAVQ